MEKPSTFRQGLEETWRSIAEGWRHLRERAAGALTRFSPSSPAASSPGDSSGDGASDELQGASPGWALLAGDVFEEKDRLVVRLEIPGMDKQDFDIQVQGDMLVVHGEKRMTSDSTEGRYRIRQCAYGSFRRVIPLPEPVLPDSARAQYRDGVLRIELPRDPSRKGRRIDIV